MTTDELNNLAAALDQWFKDNDINARDMLCKNPVAKTLKRQLSKKGRWKNLGRGKPDKGLRPKSRF